MLPLFQQQFANAGSITHQAGRYVAELVDTALTDLAAMLGATSDEIVVTSGATESNNLALFGTCLHPRQKRRKIVSVVSEHRALLDPLARLEKQGFEVVLLPVGPSDSNTPGELDLELLADAIDHRTALVSVMFANNEIGLIHPLKTIAELCRKHDVLLHTDASQAVGRIPVAVDLLDVDLLSFSAHKFYGPKGVGGLYVRQRERRVKLQAQIVGGGQQNNLRSGTINTAGIVGMTAALGGCLDGLSTDQPRIAALRDRLFEKLSGQLDLVTLNGPDLSSQMSRMTSSDSDLSLKRLPGNLNCGFYPFEGQSLMLEAPELAVSSGSACTSAEPTPSHVLLALGLSEDQARSSLRFGIGRFNTQDEIDRAAGWIVDAVHTLKKFSRP